MHLYITHALCFRSTPRLLKAYQSSQPFHTNMSETVGKKTQRTIFRFQALYIQSNEVIMYKNALESVQKFGLRICSRKWTASYQELLDIFQLPSLENWRLFLSLSTFFKIIHNLIYFPPNYCPFPLSSSFSNHLHQYSIPFAHTNCYKHLFLPNSISLWNNLPLEAVNCTTLPTFK